VTLAQAGPAAAGPAAVPDDGAWRRVAQWVACIALVMVGMRWEIVQEISTAHVAGLLLLPVWVTAPRHYWGARTVLAVGTAALALGLWLAWFSSRDHAVSLGVLVQNLALLAYVLLGVGLVLWARTLLKDWQVGLAFGIGLALAVPPGNAQYLANPWKYGLGITAAVIVLSLAARTGKRAVEVGASVALAISFAAFTARSAFGVLVLTAVIVAFQAGRPREDGRRRWFLVVAALALSAVAAYNLGVALLSEGYLGEASQQRTIRQIERSGSVLVGGRPEIAATVALIQDRPWGLGPGVAANLHDVLVAKTGMAELNYDPNNGYVERYMLGARSTLHSIVGDMWIRFGIPGLAFALTALVVLVRELAIRIRSRTASALVVYAALWTVWSFFFEPLSSAAALLVVALGLTLQRIAAPPDEAGWVERVRAGREGAVGDSPRS
jgi:hypothetical protein